MGENTAVSNLIATQTIKNNDSDELRINNQVACFPQKQVRVHSVVGSKTRKNESKSMNGWCEKRFKVC